MSEWHTQQGQDSRMHYVGTQMLGDEVSETRIRPVKDAAYTYRREHDYSYRGSRVTLRPVVLDDV